MVQKLLRKARKGTRVIFVPGNHDEFARRYVGHDFGGIEVAEEWIHVTADGRRLWVTHGDLFDGVVQCAKWLAHVGDSALRVHAAAEPPPELAARAARPAVLEPVAYLKLKVKRAVAYVGDFEAGGRARGAPARRATASSAATSTTPSCARSTACSTATTATGSRA